MTTTLPHDYQPDFIVVGGRYPFLSSCPYIPLSSLLSPINADLFVGGAAGCVIASRLSEYLPDKKVLLIEAGPTDVGNAAISEVQDWWHLLDGGFPFIRDYEILSK